MKLFLSCNAKEKTKAQKIDKKGRSPPLIYFYSDIEGAAVKNGGLVFSPQKRDKKINESIIAGIFYLSFRCLFLSDSLRLAISKNIHK